MKKELVVVKFGGSSVADAESIHRSVQIARENNAKVICVSATYNTTNYILQIINMAQRESWENTKELIDKISKNHLNIAKELKASKSDLEQIEKLINKLETLSKGTYLLKECSLKAKDEILSLGERMSSLLFTVAMNKTKGSKAENTDIRPILKTTNDYGNATPLLDQIQKNASKYFSKEDVVFVTQGFIGSDESGMTTTLGRGGSDYSASLIGEAIDADLIQIWTDVSGISTTDPKIYPEAVPIKEITFQEASELAVFGAKVLHPTSILPAKRKNIPIYVGSSYNCETEGTWIRKDTSNAPLIRAIALKKSQCVFTVSTPKMSNTYGFLARIFYIFKKFKIPVDAITTSEIAISLTVDNNISTHQQLINDLSSWATVKIEPNFSLVSIIGNNISYTPELAQKVFQALGGINVRMVCLGASNHCLSLLIEDNLSKDAVKKLHKRFLE